MSETPPHMPEPPVGLGPRSLLRQIRQLMADRRDTQERLDRIATLVARNMIAEVCSVYVLRGGVLELYATEGLNPEAVHQTTMKVGEGLVGEIARTATPLNLSDAQHHPSFAYRAETGEDPFQSFLGVPILRGGRLMGVVTVQNETHRHYGEDEVEALQTIAMLLAELLSSPEMSALAAAQNDLGPRSIHRKGQVLAEGVAIGHAVLHEPRVRVTRLVAEDPDEELKRLDEALQKLKDTIDRMLTRSDVPVVGESRDVLETYRMFAHDKGWNKRLREAVVSGLTAEAAVERVQNDARARMNRQRDQYLRERLHDLDDLANRLLRVLAGKEPTVQADELPDDAVIIARTMGPAELLDYDRSALRGLVLEEGTTMSHVAIVARALELPILGHVPGVLEEIEGGDLVVVDGEVGECHIRPTAEVVQAYQDKIALQAQAEAAFEALRDLPAVSADGVDVTLNMNAGLLVDLPHLDESGASGIGLFRTELQFMVSQTLPRIGVQTEFYKSVLDAAGDRPVTFRTVDLGGDKVVSYMAPEKEENPALGWRALRIALDRPGLLRYQARALLMAANGRPLRMMFPMVSDIHEFRAAKELVERELEIAVARGLQPPKQIQFGSMIEVPALVYQIDALAGEADFLSIGSNDLMQFFYAVDRGNPRLVNRYDMLSPAFMRFVRDIAQKAEAASIPLALCGEMAGRPLEAMALIGVGLKSISMPPSSIGPVKRMVRGLNIANLKVFMDEVLTRPAAHLREELQAFADRESVQL